MLRFWKMNGAGNDFVVFDNRDLRHSLSPEQIVRLCDRHRGVGADGVLAVEPAQNGADFRMRYYNADGGEAEMCGNGARCFARFVSGLGGVKRQQVSFETLAGVIRATVKKDKVTVVMSEPHSMQLRQDLGVAGQPLIVHSINTGVPHAVVFTPDVAKVNVEELGAALRHHANFWPHGTNANFVQELEPGLLAIRTYERGVEQETLACGTGMVAAALIYQVLTGSPSPIRLRVKGGETLEVGFDHDGQSWKDVTLTGPAEFVFSGEVDP